ncbi:MAG: hypothetical protein JXB07_17555 [Anaerolineae bacterium]|nr:hypothetical protein [Anaerolineae bacterium]
MLDEKQITQSTAKPTLVSRVIYAGFWVVLVVVLVLALRTLGFQSQGETEAYLNNQAVQYIRPTITWPVTGSPDQAAPLSSITGDIWFLDQPRVFFAETIFAGRLERGTIANGQSVYYIEFDEAGVNQYLTYWFGEWADQNARLRDAHVDLIPDGVIIYGDLNLGMHWQQVGATFHLDESKRQFTFTGVDVDGEFLTSPPIGPIAQGIDALEAEGNRALREFRFIDSEGSLFFQQIVVLEDLVQIIAY